MILYIFTLREYICLSALFLSPVPHLSILIYCTYSYLYCLPLPWILGLYSTFNCWTGSYGWQEDLDTRPLASDAESPETCPRYEVYSLGLSYICHDKHSRNLPKVWGLASSHAYFGTNNPENCPKCGV
jgi:hypothetical protein